MESKLSIRELTLTDLPKILDYWFTASDAHLEGMGVDLNKMPDRKDFTAGLTNQINLPINEKNAFCVIWEIDGKAIGHCNTNPTIFGDQANFHLHIWYPENRRQGHGLSLLRMSIAAFFYRLQLKKLVCEPYALNPAPNRAMEKLGFTFIREYTTIPGSINKEQVVKRWEMVREEYEQVRAKWQKQV